jgi:polysaccharide export outer membrane protein
MTMTPPDPSPLSRRTAVASLLLTLAGCAQLPGSGPRLEDFAADAPPAPGTSAVQLVPLDNKVVGQLAARDRHTLFSEVLKAGAPVADRIGTGDQVEITLWEAPPATLLAGAAVPDPRAPVAPGSLALPAQAVDADGFVMVPFAGRLKAAGMTPHELSQAIVARLRGKAHRPEALVRVVRKESATVTVVGEVQQSTRLPLMSGNERLLDALAAAGGARQPVHKSVVQLTRSDSYHAMPLDQVIRDPKQNVRLQPGDVITLLYQPQSLTVLGATGKQDEIAFEVQGITLAQALARAGGLIDNRAAAQGLFVFRFEAPDAVDWPHPVAVTAPDGRVPVVYQLDLRDPRSFFLMQGFRMQDRDVVYVSNAPATELQKFLNIVFSAVFPVVNLINVTR